MKTLNNNFPVHWFTNCSAIYGIRESKVNKKCKRKSFEKKYFFTILNTIINQYYFIGTWRFAIRLCQFYLTWWCERNLFVKMEFLLQRLSLSVTKTCYFLFCPHLSLFLLIWHFLNWTVNTIFSVGSHPPSLQRWVQILFLVAAF